MSRGGKKWDKTRSDSRCKRIKRRIRAEGDSLQARSRNEKQNWERGVGKKGKNYQPSENLLFGMGKQGNQANRVRRKGPEKSHCETPKLDEAEYERELTILEKQETRIGISNQFPLQS